MISFDFSSAAEIWFGRGRLRDLGGRATTFGRHALIVTGSRAERAKPVAEVLAACDIRATTYSVSGEPTTRLVSLGVAAAREKGCDFVIGFGGGSAIDSAKAIAALMTNGGDILDYLEVIGRAAPMKMRPSPCVAIPTTAGTGAEVTRNAVLESEEHGVKVSMRHRWMLPVLAIVDPALTDGLPKEVTAYTGLDALTQLIEPFVSGSANPLTDALCRDGIRRVAMSLSRAYEDGADKEARDDMALGSLFGGLALANAKLGAVHGFAGPLGGMFHGVPHGAVCAALLPHVMKANLRALRDRMPNHAALAKFRELGPLVTRDAAAGADEGIAAVAALCGKLGVKGLGALGIDLRRADEIVAKARVASSMKGNPVELSDAELRGVLHAAA